jgi:hypothetical protein
MYSSLMYGTPMCMFLLIYQSIDIKLDIKLGATASDIYRRCISVAGVALPGEDSWVAAPLCCHIGNESLGTSALPTTMSTNVAVTAPCH